MLARRVFNCLRGMRQINKYGYSLRTPDKQVIRPMEDWEYCRQISQELKSKNVDGGFNLLLQSYFHGLILDIQIYNSLFQAIQDENVPVTYAEVLYLIYRQHFPAHSLMLTWMSKLVSTENDKLLQTLKADFETIKHPFPVKRIKKNVQKEHTVIKVVSEEDVVKTKRGRIRQSSIQKQKEEESVGDDREEPRVQVVDSSLSPEEVIKMKMEADFKSLLSELNSSIGNYDAIRLYNVEISFNNDPRQGLMEDQYDNEHEHDEDDEMMPHDMGIFGLDIKHIKIGKVQFVTDPDLNNSPI